MLSRFINAGGIFSLVFLLLIIIILWSQLFWADQFMFSPVKTTFLYNVVFIICGKFQVLASFFCILMIAFAGISLNYVLASNDMIPRSSYLAAYTFVLISSIFSETIILSPAIFAGFLLVGAILLLFRLYDKFDSLPLAFNAGFLVSLASLFYFPAIAMIILVWMTFVVFRLLYWRSWINSIIGLILPYLFLATWFFWNDNLASKIAEYRNALQFVNISGLDFNAFQWFAVSLTGVFILWAFLRFMSISGERQIKTRKFLLVIDWFTILIIFCMSISANYVTFGVSLIFFPLAAMISIFMTSLKNKVYQDMILLVLIILVVVGRLGL